MFAALTFDREPVSLSWDTFPNQINTWVQIVGGFAMLGLVIWGIYYLVMHRSSAPVARALSQSTLRTLVIVLLGPVGSLLLYLSCRDRDESGLAELPADVPGARRSLLTRALFIGSFVWALFGYLLLLALYLPELIALASDIRPDPTPHWRQVAQHVLWTLAGGSALFAVLLPILADFLERIGQGRTALALRAGFRITVRRKSLGVLLVLLLLLSVAIGFVPTGAWPVWLAAIGSLLIRIAAAVWLAAFFLTLAGSRLMPARDQSPWGHLALLYVTLNCVLFVPGDWVSAHILAVGIALALGAVFLTWMVESYRAIGDFLGLRRVYAIAHLSIKEAVRRKILWVFVALLLVVLFGSWFIQGKAEDQVRTYVQVVFLAMAVLMLTASVLLAGFGIPDDIRYQTIHTVLTKPVNRFEIFLGRLIGYAALMSVVLLVVTDAALFYVLRSINTDAAQESLKARDPFYGATLVFQGSIDKEKGTNVGKEWDYRGYIEGSKTGAPKEYALWSFRQVPSELAQRDSVRLEFSLDIYRTRKANPRKGEREGEDILATFIVETWRSEMEDPLMKQRFDARKKELQARGERDVEDKLAEEFGYYEFPALEIKDFHTQSILVPGGVFRNATRPRADAEKKRYQVLQARPEGFLPLKVRVRCDTPGQFLGMARYDLYFRLDQEDPLGLGDRTRFCLNFLKGSAGLWLRLCLIIGLAVAVSTYLSGVISLLTTIILYVLGFFHEFMIEVSQGKNVGGGPMESMMRLLNRPGGEPTAGQLDESTTTQVANWFDTVFRWGMQRALNLIPDVGQLSFTDFVAEGVAIGADKMAGACLLLIGYLLPWAVLAYYLLKWREVASST